MVWQRVLDVASGVRERGRDREHHPPAHTEDAGRGAGRTLPLGSRRSRPVRQRSRARGVRRAPFGGLGMGAAETRRALMARHLPDALVDPRGPAHPPAVHDLGGSGGRRRPRTARPSHDVPERAARGRPVDVLLPVPHPGGTVLHGAAVPVGRARPQRVRDRRTTAAALDHTAPRRGRDSEAHPTRLRSHGRPVGPGRTAGGGRLPDRRPRSRGRCRDRDRSSPPGRLRCRRARIAWAR